MIKNFFPDGESASFDALIVGGGLVGGIFACLLAGQGLKVCVVESAPFASASDGRTSALSFGCVSLLDSLGVWEKISSQAQPILKILVSQSESSASISYRCDDYGPHPFGFMVENEGLRQAVFQQAQTLPQIEWYMPDAVQDLFFDLTAVHVLLQSGNRLRAPLLVAADGRYSALRQRLGLRTVHRPYNQKALVCTLQHTRSHQGTAFEHFLPQGPLAVLPLPENRSALVWSDLPERIDVLKTLPEKDFIAAFEARFGKKLGEVRLATGRATYPLNMIFCPSIVKRRVVWIGDAAHVIHPVAGQGFNLGVRDAKLLAECIGQSALLGLDIGSVPVLKNYEKRRRFDSASMTAMTHGLIHLFGIKSGPIRGLRGLGMRFIDACLPLKRRITTHASDWPTQADIGPRS